MNSWEKKIQISALKYDNSNHVVGKIKNLTKNAYDVTLKIKAKSGSLVEDITCYEMLRPNESVDLSCLTYELDDTYSLEINRVELEKKVIPSLNKGNLEVDTLEYYFPDIYESYTLNMVPFYAFFDLQYPSIENIDYEDDKITILGKIDNEFYSASIYFDYDVKTNKIISVDVFMVDSVDQAFIDNIIENMTYMDFIHKGSEINLIEKTLKRKDIQSDKCILIDKWCISANYYYSGFIVFSFDYYNK